MPVAKGLAPRAGLRRLLSDIGTFSRLIWPGHALREYQLGPARAVVAAVRGDVPQREFVLMFSRQSGKDELLAQVVAYLLVLYQHRGGSVVIALPTLRPQAVIARDRLAERLNAPRLRALGVRARVRDGFIVEVGKASAHFLSGAPTANTRGKTASLLLVGNESQDLDVDRWDSVFSPMGASTDAVGLWLGTPWTAATLLSRQRRHVESLEATDTQGRAYIVPWRAVAAELPAYGRYVERQQALLGVEHPFIKTEYELHELDGEGGLFPASRRGQMAGEHEPLAKGIAGETYALLLDVAGEEEQVEGVKAYDPTARRDSTALTVVRVVTGEERPRFEVVRRYLWTGTKHTTLYDQIRDLAKNVWRARYVVVDATGIGAGLASFLRAALGEWVVIPFIFGLASKSKLGWDFLGIIDSGRYKDYAGGDDESSELAGIFWRQVAACTYEVRPGPGRLMSWSVPDARTHDDLLLSAALVAVLDEQDWRPRRAVGR
jgi:hypothetical protein